MNSHRVLEGKVAVVTGATSGIGREISLLFAREGASVVAAGRRADLGRDLVREIELAGSSAMFVSTDVSIAEQVAQLVEAAEKAHGRINTVVSAAGMLASGTAPDTTEELWHAVIGTNLAGPFYLAKYGIPALRRVGGGTMVFVASELGLVGARESVAYCAAKGGLVNMVRALAVDSAPHGIRVNCLSPGPVDTPMLRGWFSAATDPAYLEAQQLRPVPLGRFGQPTEIARIALFLASDESSFMAGSIVVADGGATSWYGL